MKEKPEYHRGRAGEIVVREWLKEHGFWVFESGMIDSGRAPMLLQQHKKAILMDLQAGPQSGDATQLGDGYGPRWVEVKTKGRRIKYQKWNREQHGVDNWEHYLEVQQVTGIPGYLAIVETDQKQLLLGALDYIVVTKQYYDGPDLPAPRTFFDVNRFEWYDLSKGRVGELVRSIERVKPKVVRPWETGPRNQSRQQPLF